MGPGTSVDMKSKRKFMAFMESNTDRPAHNHSLYCFMSDKLFEQKF